MRKLSRIAALCSLVAALALVCWYAVPRPGFADRGGPENPGVVAEPLVGTKASAGQHLAATADEELGRVQRRRIHPTIQVIDAETRSGIAGAKVFLFALLDEGVAEVVTDGRGFAPIPDDLPIAGLAATADGYEIGAAEIHEEVLALAPLGAIEVRVIGARKELKASYALEASLEYPGLSYPWNWARGIYRRQERLLVPAVQDSCAVPRPIRMPCTITLHGRHRATSKLTKFDSAQLAAWDEEAVFETANYATPTGNWLRLRLVLPTPGPRRLSVGLEYEARPGQWLAWRNKEGIRIEPSQREFKRDYLELWPTRYRVRCTLWHSYRGEFHSRPFAVKGGVEKTIQAMFGGTEVIEVRFHGLHRGRFNAANTVLRSEKGEAQTLSEDVSEGIVRLSGMAPGRYHIRINDWTIGATFLDREVDVRAGERKVVDIQLSRAARLLVELPQGSPPILVQHVDSGYRLRAASFMRWKARSRACLLPLGRYSVQVGNRTEIVVLGEGGAKLDFSK